MRRTRNLLLTSMFAVIVFWMGITMGEAQCKKNIIAALKSNDTKTANFLWYELQKAGVEVMKQPLFFLSVAKSHLKRGDLEAVQYNLDRIIELMGK